MMASSGHKPVIREKGGRGRKSDNEDGGRRERGRTQDSFLTSGDVETMHSGEEGIGGDDDDADSMLAVSATRRGRKAATAGGGVDKRSKHTPNPSQDDESKHVQDADNKSDASADALPQDSGTTRGHKWEKHAG